MKQTEFMARKVIIVHIPKAAGQSLRRAVIEKFGNESIGFEYDKPMAKSKWLRNINCLIQSLRKKNDDHSVIFGHFLVGKHSDLSFRGFSKKNEHAYVTFLRDPLQRAVSHYFHWKRRNPKNHRMWEQFSKENWTLERFLLSKEFSNLQSQFLWRFPIEQFDFIGISEKYEESLSILGYVLPELAGLSLCSENFNPNKNKNEKYLVDSCLAEEFKRLNGQDYELYERALEIFAMQKYRLNKDGYYLPA